MFYIILSLETKSANQIPKEIGRDYESVLKFIREVQEIAEKLGGIELEGICEADEVYVNSGDKGVKDDDPGGGDYLLREGELTKEIDHLANAR